MKKINVLFLAVSLICLVAGKNGFSQAAVSHSAQQDLEVSVPGKGGPTIIKQGETKVLPYVSTNGSVNFLVRYKVGKKYEERTTQMSVRDGKVNIPEPPGANREAKPTAIITDVSQVSAKAKDRISDKSDFNPEIGKVNIIKDLTTDIPAFPLRMVNEASGKGELLFLGNIFTGFAAKAGDTIVSRELVRPGLVELTVIYKMPYVTGGISGQSFTLAQQALVYMVTDSSQIITISDNDFFDFATLAEDIPIRFKNVGAITLYPKSGDKKMNPLRPNRASKSIKFASARAIMWYYYDSHNVQRLAVWEIVPGDKPIIRIRSMEHIYGTGR